MKKLSIILILSLLIVSGCKKTSNEERKISIQTTLITPVNNAIIPTDTEVQFSWKSTSENTKDPISNKIKIVELIGDQSPEQAFKGNKPFFERDSIELFRYVHPKTGVKFLPGKSYAWIVTAKQSGGTLEGGQQCCIDL